MLLRQVELLNTKYGVDVPLVLMNSFNTHEETERVLSKYAEHNLTILTFTQHYFPRYGCLFPFVNPNLTISDRIDKSTMAPIPTGSFEKANAHQWYPPGHGDVYASLVDSGLMEKLIGKNKSTIYLYISRAKLCCFDNVSS